MTHSEQFLRSYLDALEIHGYVIEAKADPIGLLLLLTIPNKNHERIGMFKGKKGESLSSLKRLLRVVGLSEHEVPYLIVKLID